MKNETVKLIERVESASIIRSLFVPRYSATYARLFN